MKYSITFGLGLVVCSVTAQGNLPTFPQAVQNLPSCAYDAFASAMNSEGCSTSDITAETFNCLCNQHTGSIVTAVALNTNGNCDDFAGNYGTMCGLYETQTSSSDMAAAVAALKSEVGGKGSSGSSTASASGAGTTSAASSSANAASSSASAASTTSSAGAAAPTAINIGGILGPAIAAIAMLA